MIIASGNQFYVYLPWGQRLFSSVLNVKAVVAAFNQEKALVGAFSVITNLRMQLFEALVGMQHATHCNPRLVEAKTMCFQIIEI